MPNTIQKLIDEAWKGESPVVTGKASKNAKATTIDARLRNRLEKLMVNKWATAENCKECGEKIPSEYARFNEAWSEQTGFCRICGPLGIKRMPMKSTASAFYMCNAQEIDKIQNGMNLVTTVMASDALNIARQQVTLAEHTLLDEISPRTTQSEATQYAKERIQARS